MNGTDRRYSLRIRPPTPPHTHKNTHTQFWKKYAAEASRQQISIDAFCFSAAYTDLASIGALPKYTCVTCNNLTMFLLHDLLVTDGFYQPLQLYYLHN